MARRLLCGDLLPQHHRLGAPARHASSTRRPCCVRGRRGAGHLRQLHSWPRARTQGVIECRLNTGLACLPTSTGNRYI
eukprot:10520802-Alexandrium_andersonii.AAC.1